MCNTPQVAYKMFFIGKEKAACCEFLWKPKILARCKYFFYVLSNKGHLFNFVPTIWIAVADKAKMCTLYGHIFSSLKKMFPRCLNVIVTYLVIKKIFFLDSID